MAKPTTTKPTTTKPTTTPTTPTTTTTTKPATLWRAMAQATPKGARALFESHAWELAGAYTGSKQLLNEMERVASQWGLNPIFKAVHVAAKEGGTPAEVFEGALVALYSKAPTKAKAKAKPKAPTMIELLGFVAQYSHADLNTLKAEIDKALSGVDMSPAGEIVGEATI